MRSRPDFGEVRRIGGAPAGTGGRALRTKRSVHDLAGLAAGETVPVTHQSRAVRHGRGATGVATGDTDTRQGMLDVPGLADYLAVSEKFVRRLVDQRRIPFRKVGRLVRFDPAEVAQWLASCKVDAVR